MRRVWIGIVLVAMAAPWVAADENLRISDVGLHGYGGSPGIQVIVRNPLPGKQTIHLELTAAGQYGVTYVTKSDTILEAGEQRQLELPLEIAGGNVKITAEASAGGSVFARDDYEGTLRNGSLVALLCTDEKICKGVQSQIEFSGSIEDRADKNRGLKYEVVNDPRDEWWAYSAASAVILAMPVSKFTPAKRQALEGYLRMGGRLVLLEQEIADSTFLSAYRTQMPTDGVHVGRGRLLGVASLGAKKLGDIFTGANLQQILGRGEAIRWQSPVQENWLQRRFGTTFHFPRLRWMLVWLAAYIVIIGVVNFGVLRRLHRLEYGWVSMCGLALLFAGGLYVSSASRRPKQFRLDNLAMYYLDGRSALATANYNLRISAPQRRDVDVSVADSGVIGNQSTFADGAPNSQIWTEMNRRAVQIPQVWELDLGPPLRLQMELLKWSFRDLSFRGMREFPGTVHFVAPKRLRNDTGQRFEEAVYVDYEERKVYAVPSLAPGEEMRLDTIEPDQISDDERSRQNWNVRLSTEGGPTLLNLALANQLPGRGGDHLFAGFSDGPALPVELSVAHENNVHSLVIVGLEQP